MSLPHSISVDSSSSTSTMTTIPPVDLANNSSNDLYEDRNHFQAIFSNDSRFFDTSLHLFKSYYALGYISSNNEKQKKVHVPFLTTTSNGHKHRWRPRLLGTSLHKNDNHNGVLKAFLTPTLLRKSDPSTSNHSDSGISEAINQQEKSPMIVHYRSTVPSIQITNDDQYDESEVTITRL